MTTANHKQKQLEFKDVKVFECLACHTADKMAYTEFYHVEMHVLTKAHIQNSKAPNAGLVRPMVKNDIPENRCVLCSVDVDPIVGKSHLQSSEHNR